jgi:hypothetical protein
MATQAPVLFDESRLLTIELDAAPLTEVALGAGAEDDPRLKRYLETFPPSTALHLVQEVRELRAALRGAVSVLESAGYTLDAYCRLDEAERESPEWTAVRRAREACAAWPEYVMRYTRGGQEHSRSFSTREAALDGAIEVIEMREGYPRVIEMEGRNLMDCNDILHAWEDRHDPG